MLPLGIFFCIFGVTGAWASTHELIRWTGETPSTAFVALVGLLISVALVPLGALMTVIGWHIWVDQATRIF